MPKEIEIHKERFYHMCDLAVKRYEEGNGFWKKAKQKYLPQWNLPEELERGLVHSTDKSLKAAANYLFLMAQLERRVQSKQNIINAKQIGEDSSKKFIFDQSKVASKQVEEIARILREDLKYPFKEIAQHYMVNCKELVENWGGDPRNLIKGYSIEEARKNIQLMKGMGNGIANLLLIYLGERKIVSIQDLNKLCPKVDIHKTRIPLNVGATEIQEGLRRDAIVPLLEEAYKDVVGGGLNPFSLDAALWIIGSEICKKKNAARCATHCPLEKMCTNYWVEDKPTTKIFIQTDADFRKQPTLFQYL